MSARGKAISIIIIIIISNSIDIHLTTRSACQSTSATRRARWPAWIACETNSPATSCSFGQSRRSICFTKRSTSLARKNTILKIVFRLGTGKRFCQCFTHCPLSTPISRSSTTTTQTFCYRTTTTKQPMTTIWLDWNQTTQDALLFLQLMDGFVSLGHN